MARADSNRTTPRNSCHQERGPFPLFGAPVPGGLGGGAAMKPDAPLGIYPRFMTPFLSQAPGSFVFVYAELLTYRNRDGLAWPSQALIARRTNLNRSTVKRAFRWLREHSLIRERGRASFGSKRYYMPLTRKELPIVSAAAVAIDGEGASAPPVGLGGSFVAAEVGQPDSQLGGSRVPQTDEKTEEHSAPLDELGEQILYSDLLLCEPLRHRERLASQLASLCASVGLGSTQVTTLVHEAMMACPSDPARWLAHLIRRDASAVVHLVGQGFGSRDGR